MTLKIDFTQPPDSVVQTVWRALFDAASAEAESSDAYEAMEAMERMSRAVLRALAPITEDVACHVWNHALDAPAGTPCPYKCSGAS